MLWKEWGLAIKLWGQGFWDPATLHCTAYSLTWGKGLDCSEPVKSEDCLLFPPTWNW